MRVKKVHTEFLKKSVEKYLSDASVYLFGSRANDLLKGGDIDILVIGEKKLTGQEKRNIKIAFYKEFGVRKIDIVSYQKSDSSKFKKLALLEGIQI